jgi:tol-pal system protein YbgF
MPRTYRLFVALSGLLLAACGSIDVIAKKQMETDARLEQLLLKTSTQSTQLADLSREMQAIKDQVAAQDKTVSSLKTGQESLKSSLDGIAREAVAPPSVPPTAQPQAKIEVVNVDPARDSAKPDRASAQQEAYMKAFGIFSANRLGEAISAFTEFIATYPDSEFAGNAQYWIGECHYTQKEFHKSLAAFSRVLEKYPQGKKVPDAMLKVAFSQLSLNYQAAAKTTLQKLIDTYPKSPAAAKARERLIRL